MKKAAIICIGKIKTSYWQNACQFYLKQIRYWRGIEAIEIKDGPANLKPAERIAEEGKRLLTCLKPGDLPIALSELGKQYTSPQFADFLRHCDENLIKRPAFIIGGPFGLAQAILAQCPQAISLSTMTWTHEMARVLLLEQLYRAESILHNTPYHH